LTPAIVTEPCPLCRSPETRVHYQLTGYRIAECRTCGFEFHDGFQGGGGERRGDMFSAEYYTERHSSAFGIQLAGDYERDPSAPVYGRWLGEIASRLPGGRRRILDVGCALGTFLALARDRGFEPHGVEISEFASGFAREKRGLDVFTGDLEGYRATDASFDVVTFWDAIEHVTHPLENLRTARRLLRPGGLLLLTTDNFDCLVADVARVSYRASGGALRYAMQRVFIDANRSYFTEATLRGALETAQFRVQLVEKMEYPIDKIRTTALERVVLQAFYGAAALLHREAQVTVLAEAR
jgi:2-polyprenyl-3-methyl-5-hydroxy-6-metoxy-1,4-benzoquinol methylase